jgi:hypothetical protein
MLKASGQIQMGYVLTIAACIASFFYTFPLIYETTETLAGPSPWPWSVRNALGWLAAFAVIGVQICLIYSAVLLYTWNKGKLRRAKPS